MGFQNQQNPYSNTGMTSNYQNTGFGNAGYGQQAATGYSQQTGTGQQAATGNNQWGNNQWGGASNTVSTNPFSSLFGNQQSRLQSSGTSANSNPLSRLFGNQQSSNTWAEALGMATQGIIG